MTYQIMIVDDQFVSRELFKLYIDQSPQYEVVYSIDSAMFADTYVLKNHIDLIIMDILMQDGSNGLDAAEKIKKLRPDIKIVAVTSMPEVSWMDRAKKNRDRELLVQGGLGKNNPRDHGSHTCGRIHLSERNTGSDARARKIDGADAAGNRGPKALNDRRGQ